MLQWASSGSNNPLVQPAAPDARGVAAAPIATPTAEPKTITATVNPGPGEVVVAQQPDVVFVGDPNNLSAALSTATAAPATNVVANGAATSTITVTVRDVNGNPVAGQSEALVGEGVVKGGMIPKVKTCVQAVRRGIPRAHILNGLEPHAILLELFTVKGTGTMITLEAVPPGSPSA